ncbi:MULTISPECIES: hypothetical protein [unclassified Streptomyces]|uniref:hypothetical protein n=1 Tax=unclassified Streptomyces TaxID=2593676 RepID=UPI002DD91C92|nr:hypothetical protein [Streptomyces sp. NBC_01237]WRZ72729.1 hypothetical protein OG251_14415 [Streptomyces sp. NBC_01237]
MRVVRALSVIGLVLTVGAGAVACGSEEKKESPYVGAGEVCGGVFAGPLEKTVETVTGATSFDRTGEKRMDRVVEALKKGYASGRSWATGYDLCVLGAEGAGRRDDVKINFSIYAPQDVGDTDLRGGARMYSMGKEATAGAVGARINFECVSPQLEGSKERPARIKGGFGNAKDRGTAPEDLAANLTLAHAASLAVAKKLGCEDNGGLPEKPDLQPLP